MPKQASLLVRPMPEIRLCSRIGLCRRPEEGGAAWCSGDSLGCGRGPRGRGRRPTAPLDRLQPTAAARGSQPSCARMISLLAFETDAYDKDARVQHRIAQLLRLRLALLARALRRLGLERRGSVRSCGGRCRAVAPEGGRPRRLDGRDGYCAVEQRLVDEPRGRGWGRDWWSGTG
jgi:hypothetical protein